MTRLPDAVAWDFDGTLMNTEVVWQRIERGLAAELGGTLPHDYHDLVVGGTVDHTARYIKEAVGSDADLAWIAAELWDRAKRTLASGPLPWMPGAAELLTAFADAGVPQALVSSGHRSYLEVTLRRLPPHTFAAVVAGDEVTHGKPHPESYLAAAAALGVAPQRCLVIEDSGTGSRAALAAGCVVVVAHAAGAVPDDPRLVRLEALAALGVADLASLFATARAADERP